MFHSRISKPLDMLVFIVGESPTVTESSRMAKGLTPLGHVSSHLLILSYPMRFIFATQPDRSTYSSCSLREMEGIQFMVSRSNINCSISNCWWGGDSVPSSVASDEGNVIAIPRSAGGVPMGV